MGTNVIAEDGRGIAERSRQVDSLQMVLLALAILLTVILGGLTWAQRAGWSLDRPEVLGMSPPNGTRSVPGNAPLAISFNMPMNPDSVRGNLKIDPPTEGQYGWDGNTLIFTPTVGYSRGVTYTIEMGAGASNPLFQSLAAPSTVSFRTAGLPSVYRSVPPADASEVPTDTMVTIQFSAPMVPLAALDSRPVSNSPEQVQISPATDGGRWQWLGTTTLAYRAASLAPATHYTVNVAKSFTDIAGGQLDRDYSFSFDTVRPGVLFTAPAAGGKYVGINDPIVVQFNQPVDHASAEAGFALEPAATISFAWSADSTVMTATLAADLTRDTDYKATLNTLKPLAGSGAGDLTMAAPFSWSFHSSPLARVINNSPGSGVTDVKVGTQIMVTYSAPLSTTTEDLTAGVVIEPEVRGVAAYAFDENTTLNIYAQLAPSTQYKITVGANGKYHDRNGVTVDAYSWTFTTAPLDPSAYAINNSHLTSFYGDAPTRAYIEAVNVEFVRLRVWRLSGDELLSYMRLTPEQQAQYQPATDVLRMWDLPVEQVLNKRQALYPNLALDENSDRLPPGFYYLRVTSPETIDGTAVIVGNTALTMKKSAQEVLVWAVDMRDGKPLAGRELRFDSDGKEVGRATTDADGLARLSGNVGDSYTLVALAEGAGDAGLVSAAWTDGIAIWNYNIDASGASGNLNSAIYTDRPIYRPGQTVHFKGILRDDNDGKYSLPAQRDVKITINDTVGQQVYSGTLALSEYGSFAADYVLPDYAPLGDYYITLAQNDQYFGTPFAVQEYRKPEYLVEVSTDKQDYVQGENIAATASATYFFGGPVAGAEVTTRVQAQDYYFSWTDPDSGDYYDFQDWQDASNMPGSFGGQVRSETSTTSDANGQVKWDVPADTGGRTLSQLLTIEAAVRDSSNQEIANSSEVIVHKGQFYIGLRPDVYVATAGNTVGINLQLVGIDKQPFGPTSVKLSYFKRVWEQTTEKDENGLDRPTWQPKDTLLSSADVQAGADGKGNSTFVPSEAGQYRILAEAHDSRGNTITSATYVWVSDAANDDAVVGWQQTSNYAIEMVADKKEYKPGDTARILVTSPFRAAKALLTIERGTIISYRVIDLVGSSPVIEIPIPAGFLPNVYLGLTVIAPGSAEGAPALRQGWLGLNVSNVEKKLGIEIAPSSDKVQPRDTVTYTITTKDAAGNPVPAEVSVALVDKAIYSLADDTSTALMDQFYGHRALGFTTSSSMLALQTLINPVASPGAKGGGGGADAAGFVRRTFEDSAYWQADIVTGADGTAQVAVKLPDNLTTWRLTARAITKDTLVSEGTNEIIASKDLLVRPVLPRFMLTGDRATTGAIVHNYTEADLSISVTLAISGATLLDPTTVTQQLNIPAGGEAVANFAIEAGVGSSAVFTYTATAMNIDPNADLSDAVSVSVPVEPLLVPEVVATSGEVEGDSTQQEQVFLPHGVDTRFGELKVDVSPSLAASTAKSLQFLENQQWESSETIVSRFLPLLRLNNAYRAALQASPYADKLDNIVNGGLQKLYTLQQYDGGWSWWSSGNTDPWITSYVLEGLAAARAAGYPVTDQSINSASDYLTNWLSAETPSGANGERLNTRAYVIYALTLAGKGDISQARALAARANSLALYGRAYLALAFQRQSASDDAKVLLDTIVATTKQTSTTAHWEEETLNPEYYISMSSNTRTTALVMQALLMADKDDPLVAKAVRWIMDARREGHWLTSQESATVVDSLAQYLLTSGELGGQYSWTATLNNAPFGNGTVGPNNVEGTVELRRSVADLLINENNTLLLERQGNTGKMYYDVSLSYYIPNTGIAARNEGLSIVREYIVPGSDKDGGVPVQVKTAAAGDLVEVKLTVILPTEAYYLTIEDPLPAGLESLNGTLDTTGLTAQLDQRQVTDKDGNPLWWLFNNVEMRDDSTALFSTYIPAGVYEYRYLARATTPGVFTALPARAYLAYHPDVWGRSDGSTFAVSGK